MTHGERYYKERKYEAEAFWSSLGTAIVFTIVGIISVILAVTDFDFIGLSYWGFWLFIPAFFIYIGAFNQLFKNNKLKNQVLAALHNYHGQKVVLENLAAEVMMRSKDLMRVLIDLRADYRIKFRYDQQTGELIIGEEAPMSSPVTSAPASTSSGSSQFCRACGRRVDKENSAFCTSCGTEL